jgi:LysR family transcriptional regulator, low CO2-responsive transcriptional regulator
MDPIDLIYDSIMNLTQLRAFHLVAVAGSFTLAARTAGISQPTLSSQVRTLEAAYGVSLFDRKERGARPTPLGQSLYQLTTQLFAMEEQARVLLAGTKWAVRGHLRVAADSAYHIIPVLAAMRDHHRGLSFQLRIGNSADVMNLLLGFEVDVAVTARPVSDPQFASQPLRRDRLVVFVPVDHNWADRGMLEIEDLAGCDLVIRERGSITREVFEARLAEARVQPKSLFEVQTREAVREAVASNFGIGVVFLSEFGVDPRFRALTISGPGLEVGEYAVALVERRRLSLISLFFDTAKTLAEDSGWLDDPLQQMSRDLNH